MQNGESKMDLNKQLTHILSEINHMDTLFRANQEKEAVSIRRDVTVYIKEMIKEQENG